MQQFPNLVPFSWAGSDQFLCSHSWTGTFVSELEVTLLEPGRTGRVSATNHEWDPTKAAELHEKSMSWPAWIPHLCKQRAPRSFSTAEPPPKQLMWHPGHHQEKFIYPQNSHRAARTEIPLLNRNAQVFFSFLNLQEHPCCALTATPKHRVTLSAAATSPREFQDVFWDGKGEALGEGFLHSVRFQRFQSNSYHFKYRFLL